MSTIAKMAVQLSLEAQQFNAGLQSALGKVKAFAGATVGALAGSAVVRGFVGTIRELENVGDAAAAAGVGVGEYMAAVGELNSEDTQAATTALNKMGKALAELATGSKEKAKDFREAGLKPEDFQAQGTYEALRIVAKAYTEAEDPVKKLAIAYAAFGKSAAEVIPVLDKLAAQSGEIGGKFAGTRPEDIATAAQAEAQITRVENAFKGFKNRLAVDTFKVFQDTGAFFGGKDIAEERFQEWKKLRDEAAKRPELAKIQELARVQEEERKAVREFIKDIKSQREAIEEEIAAFGKGKGAGKAAVLAEQAKRLGNVGAGDQRILAIEHAQAAAFRLDELEKAKEFAQNFGKHRSTPADFRRFLGQMVRDKIAPFSESLTQTSPTLQRGSAEEGSFRAKFEQSFEGVKTTNEQMLDLFRQAIALDQKNVAATEQLGRLFEQRFPIFKIAGLAN